MTISRAAGTRILALAFLATVSGLALAGCGTIDEALFSGSTEAAAPPPANAPGAAAGAPEGAPPGMAAPAPAPVATEMAPPPGAIGSEITPVAVEPGSDTGTSVSHTIANLRSQLASLETKLGTDGQRYADLHNTAAQATATYQQSTAGISTRLGVGTTRGNPELIAQWNTAQGALDALTGNINALSALATEVSNDSSAAHYEQDTIQATFNVSGAVDEDHRQLSVLSDETGQTIVLVDRLMSDVSQTIQRQTAYVGNERGNLTTLASAIKAGEYYAPLLTAPSAMASNAGFVASGSPIVTIRFARNRTNYERELYSALSQALAARPSASFNVIGISPTRGSATAVQLAQNSAQRHAQDVMRTMGEMGVPATRIAASSSTDPSVTSSEVRVYVR
jgi:hypothetical protein